MKLRGGQRGGEGHSRGARRLIPVPINCIACSQKREHRLWRVFDCFKPFDRLGVIARGEVGDA